MSDETSPAPLCSRESLDADEPLAGTAAEVRAWIALEVRAPWSARGFPDVDLPAETIALLRQQRARGARIQLIRQPRRQEGPLRLLVANGLRARAWGFDLDTLAALDRLPWAAMLSGDGPEPDAARLTVPAVLVCTHGRRDRCCALLGTATWLALSAADTPAEVWQTTHLGGHRFAPTLLTLPDGICYGRLSPAEAPALHAALAADRPYSAHAGRWRGRCAWPPPAQAAEIQVRQQHPDPDLPADALTLLDCTPQDGGWRVCLALAGGAVLERTVIREDLPTVRRKSCADAESGPAHALTVRPG